MKNRLYKVIRIVDVHFGTQTDFYCGSRKSAATNEAAAWEYYRAIQQEYFNMLLPIITAEHESAVKNGANPYFHADEDIRREVRELVDTMVYRGERLISHKYHDGTIVSSRIDDISAEYYQEEYDRYLGWRKEIITDLSHQAEDALRLMAERSWDNESPAPGDYFEPMHSFLVDNLRPNLSNTLLKFWAWQDPTLCGIIAEEGARGVYYSVCNELEGSEEWTDRRLRLEPMMRFRDFCEILNYCGSHGAGHRADLRSIEVCRELRGA